MMKKRRMILGTSTDRKQLDNMSFIYTIKYTIKE
jgi:hypothetical protein